MPKLLDYLEWRGDVDLDYDGFNEIDAAILCVMSYIPYEMTGKTIERQGILLRELAVYTTAVPDIKVKLQRPGDIELCRKLSECRRYENVRVYNYVSRWDIESESQFSAISFKISDDLCCVAFRGTDDTLVGWKEDLNMCLTFPIPAQAAAAQYLEETARLVGSENYIVCGHSKGGNLAVYSAAFCNSALQAKIERVYNFDGPGLQKEALEREEYKRFAQRITTIVPQFSVIGMIFDMDRPRKAVKNGAVGIAQHNLHSWEVRNGGFDYVEDITDGSKMMAQILNSWLEETDMEERESFVEAVYQIMTQNNATKVEELSSKKLENAIQALRTIRKLDEKTRSNAIKAVRLLMSNLRPGA